MLFYVTKGTRTIFKDTNKWLVFVDFMKYVDESGLTFIMFINTCQTYQAA